MGSKPKAPDNSAQIRASQEQSAELKRQQEEARLAKEALAKENTEELMAIRRRSRGRASLISTTERGVRENNGLGRGRDVSAREAEVERINAEGRVAAEKRLADERLAAQKRKVRKFRGNPMLGKP